MLANELINIIDDFISNNSKALNQETLTDEAQSNALFKNEICFSEGNKDTCWITSLECTEN